MKKEDINDLTSNEKQKIIKQYLSMYKDLNTISELTGIKYHTVVYYAKLPCIFALQRESCKFVVPKGFATIFKRKSSV